MRDAGIDTAKFLVHSIRGIASATAIAYGTPVNRVIELGKWDNVGTLIRHYFKPQVEQKREKPKNLEQKLKQIQLDHSVETLSKSYSKLKRKVGDRELIKSVSRQRTEEKKAQVLRENLEKFADEHKTVSLWKLDETKEQ